MLLVVPKVLEGDALAALRTSLESHEAPWVDGRLTAGHQAREVKNNLQLDASNAAVRGYSDSVIAALDRNLLFISAALPHRLYPPMFNRYADGMNYGTHVDVALRTHPYTGQQIRSDLSATLFLSPPDSYDGGELQIERNGIAHMIKLAAGDMIVYSASTRHSVKPVTRGARLASFFWIQSMVRDDGLREKLHELDTAIQRLSQSGADAQAIIQLSNLYHNLLRLWSEV
jgi:PKHD-type hydroxylase